VGTLLGALHGPDWIPDNLFKQIGMLPFLKLSITHGLEHPIFGKEKIIEVAKSIGLLNFEFYSIPPDLKKT
jgi:hypothetical protein